MSNASQADLILVDVEDAVQHIRFNRPDKKNAVSLAMYAAMAEALGAAGADDNIRVILISGSEGCFCGGNDLEDFLKNPRIDESSPTIQFLHAISQARKPLIAAVSGPAIGIGTTLLLHCDLVYADSSAVFQLPFVNLGLCPEAASSFLLPQLVGHQRAAELLLLGERFSAAKAYELGLVNQVCEPKGLFDLAWEKATQLARQPAASVRLTKALMKQAQVAAVLLAISAEAEQFVERLASPEAKEAMQAFFERRAPDFSRFQ